MPANGLFKNFTREGDGGPGSSRQRSILIAVVLAIVAFLLIFLYVHNHHSSNNSGSSASSNTTVVVAVKDIPKGALYSNLASNGELAVETVKAGAAEPGAFTSASQLAGMATTKAIQKGEQATSGNFAAIPSGAAANLSGNQRLITLSLDAQHGQTAILQPQAHVDVLDYLSSKGQTQLIATNLVVSQNSGGEVTLIVTQGQAMLLAAAQSSGSLWLAIRGVGATDPIHVGSTWSAPHGS